MSNFKHTDIDNTLAKPSAELIKNYLEKGINPVEVVKKMKTYEKVENDGTGGGTSQY